MLSWLSPLTYKKSLSLIITHPELIATWHPGQGCRSVGLSQLQVPTWRVQLSSRWVKFPLGCKIITHSPKSLQLFSLKHREQLPLPLTHKPRNEQSLRRASPTNRTLWPEKVCVWGAPGRLRAMPKDRHTTSNALMQCLGSQAQKESVFMSECPKGPWNRQLPACNGDKAHSQCEMPVRHRFPWKSPKMRHFLPPPPRVVLPEAKNMAGTRIPNGGRT